MIEYIVEPLPRSGPSMPTCEVLEHAIRKARKQVIATTIQRVRDAAKGVETSIHPQVRLVQVVGEKYGYDKAIFEVTY